MTMWMNYWKRDLCRDCRFYNSKKKTNRCELRAIKAEERGEMFSSNEERETFCRSGRGLHTQCFERKKTNSKEENER